jgi:hypothetical protein
MEHVAKNLWRLHIKHESHVKVPDRCRFCVEGGFAGVGWKVQPHQEMLWSEYCQLAKSSGTPKGVNDNVRRLHDLVKSDDLVWSRDASGKYYVGRITGGWEYRCGTSHDDADIHNVRSCDWREVGDLCEVPGTVRNAFIRGKTLQSITNTTMRRFSMDLYNRLLGQTFYTLPPVELDLLSLLDPDGCEDLVGIFMQLRGWLIYPSTCKTATPNFEFTLRHRFTRRMGAVQVKQGDEELRVSQYEGFDGDVFLFQTNAKYIGQPTKPTTILLDPVEMKRFCVENVSIMPAPIKRWVEWVTPFTSTEEQPGPFVAPDAYEKARREQQIAHGKYLEFRIALSKATQLVDLCRGSPSPTAIVEAQQMVDSAKRLLDTAERDGFLREASRQDHHGELEELQAILREVLHPLDGDYEDGK